MSRRGAEDAFLPTLQTWTESLLQDQMSNFDPMLEEAEQILLQHALGRDKEMQMRPEQAKIGSAYGPEENEVMSAGENNKEECCQTGATKYIEEFLVHVSTTVPPPMLSTPATNKPEAKMNEDDERKLRRSGRIAEKKKAMGNKNTEELAQEVLSKKLGNLTLDGKMNEEVRSKFVKMFDGPLSDEVMDAIEDILKVMNIDTKKKVKGGNKGVAKTVKC